MKKVYIVKSNNGHIEGVYATAEKAEKARKDAEWGAGMAGRYDLYFVEEYEVQE